MFHMIYVETFSPVIIAQMILWAVALMSRDIVVPFQFNSCHTILQYHVDFPISTSELRLDECRQRAYIVPWRSSA